MGSVELSEVEVVLPSSPTPSEILHLHSIEQAIFNYNEMGLVYKSSPELAYHELVELLRVSLAKLLVPYHFVAGRYKVNEELCRLELNCNEAGALFAAGSSSLSIDQVSDFSSMKELFLYPKNVKSMEDIPLLTLQVTRFVCGGLVVAFCVHHTVMDGVSLSKLFNDYASIVSSKGKAEVKTPEFKRTIMKARSPLQISFPHREFMSLPFLTANLCYDPAHYDQQTPAAPPNVTYKTFKFTPDMINQLKQIALAGSEDLEFCSSFEVVTAHIWQARAKAFQDPESTAPSKLFLVMNVREKLGMKSDYVGNGIVQAPCIDISMQEICKNDFSFCVKQVQKTIRNVTEEYVHSALDWCEANHGIIDIPGGLVITTLSKLGFENIDFGWGKPVYFFTLVSGRTDCVTLLNNFRGDGGLDIFVGMKHEKDMEKFETHFNHV